MNSHPKTFALTTLLVLFGLALADVRVQTASRMSLVGGLGTIEANAVTEYQSDKRAEALEFRIVGGVMGAFSKGTQATTEIMRLDKDLIWELDRKAKTYTESPIALPTQEELSGVKAEPGSPEKRPESHFRVTKSDLEVEKTGKTKEVNGFPCTEYLLTWELVLEDTASKQKVDQLMTVNEWTTPLTDVLKKAKAAEDEFNTKMAKKLGTRMTAAEMQQLGAGMLTASYGLDSKDAAANLEKVSKELAKIEGYPIVTDVAWKVKADSAAKPESEPEEEKEESKSSRVPSLSGLSSKLAKKMVKEPDRSKKDVLFSSYSEIKAVALDPVPDANFEIPEGFKKAGEK